MGSLSDVTTSNVKCPLGGYACILGSGGRTVAFVCADLYDTRNTWCECMIDQNAK